ncbi:D-alanyl-D-alanine carboxypeptidase family protein [Anoxynatronum buryatiense]|uniref:D-alanyl-D-alanine dipeptidase/carboxypeptidase n=1 Tax=Anoxynatronum buryatiense TaxID=489973 RepID=A0AA45WVX1_9CLOT|nr:D-alanyl-D-alanine carboxypeptidase family protein [Anoxynatronum buryatiense]SMP56015.1 D-alanyl-D-alanine dipeptidase/carboxypeptidase [Anoxynatronum buryatiense]
MKTIILKKEDVYRGNLVLINKEHLVKMNEGETVAKLVAVSDKDRNHLINRDAAKALQHTLDEINAQEKIVPVSAFRSKQQQTHLYRNAVNDHGIDFTRKFVAKPDASEHQSGLAIDLGENKKKIDFICPDFPYHGVFNRFRAVAKKMGFIERYQEGKESITGISKEPWHFRYVGYPHSVIMVQKDFALEEYHDFIKNYTSADNSYRYECENKEIKLFFIKATAAVQTLCIGDDDQCEVSGNNHDGFIVTLHSCSA